LRSSWRDGECGQRASTAAATIATSCSKMCDMLIRGTLIQLVRRRLLLVSAGSRLVAREDRKVLFRRPLSTERGELTLLDVDGLSANRRRVRRLLNMNGVRSRGCRIGGLVPELHRLALRKLQALLVRQGSLLRRRAVPALTPSILCPTKWRRVTGNVLLRLIQATRVVLLLRWLLGQHRARGRPSGRVKPSLGLHLLRHGLVGSWIGVKVPVVREAIVSLLSR
jgi:hypothetical protein